MSEIIKQRKLPIPRKAVALLTAATLSLGLSACGEKNQSENDAVDGNRLSKIIKPKLNSLGAKAICLSKHSESEEFLDSYYNRKDKTFVINAEAADSDNDGYSFSAVVGTKPGTEQPDPEQTLSLRVHTVTGQGLHSTSTYIDAPNQSGKKYHSIRYSSGLAGNINYGAEYSTEGYGDFKTDSIGEATAITTAKSLTSKENMKFLANSMNYAVKNTSGC